MEETQHLSRLPLSGRTVLVDCITLWVHNLLHQHGGKKKPSLDKFISEWNRIKNLPKDLFLVSNELSLGIHPSRLEDRIFVDLHGEINQMVSKEASSVTLMIAGLAWYLKGSKQTMFRAD